MRGTVLCPVWSAPLGVKGKGGLPVPVFGISSLCSSVPTPLPSLRESRFWATRRTCPLRTNLLTRPHARKMTTYKVVHDFPGAVSGKVEEWELQSKRGEASDLWDPT